MNSDSLIPILIFLGGFTLTFGWRYLVNKENMAMIEKGVTLQQRKKDPFMYMRIGLMFIGAGLGLFLAYMLDKFVFFNQDQNQPIYFALILFFGGLGLFIAFIIDRKMRKEESQ